MLCEKITNLIYDEITYCYMAKIRFGVSIEEEIVKALDKAIAEKKRFANRSQGIEYCISQVLELEKHEERYIEFLVEFLEIVERHPEVGEKLRRFLEKEGED
jgi:metal-responsive CopG/Arc/MetJ family transcriptional regulator